MHWAPGDINRPGLYSARVEDEHAVDVRGLAELLQVSVTTVYRLAATREIPSFKVGSRIRFWPSEVRRSIEQRDPWARSNQARARRRTTARKAH